LQKLSAQDKIKFFPLKLSALAILASQQIQSDAVLFKYASTAILGGMTPTSLSSELQQEAREQDEDYKETTRDFSQFKDAFSKFYNKLTAQYLGSNSEDVKKTLEEISDDQIKELNEQFSLEDLTGELTEENLDKIVQEIKTLEGIDGQLMFEKTVEMVSRGLAPNAAKIRNLRGQFTNQQRVIEQISYDLSSENEDLQGSKNIYYITLGDIIDVVAEDILESDMNIMVGPARVGDYILNLCDFPISLKSFEAWFIANVISQSKTSYYLWDFIQDIFTSLVHSNLLSYNLISQNKLQLNVQSTSVVSDNPLARGTVNNADKLINKLSPAIFNYDKIYSYLVLYLYDYRIQDREGDLSIDYKDGIYHYYRALNKGIVKSIKFNKIDFPRYRDMKLMNSRLNQPGEILREHYSARLEVIGCPLFAIGGLLYINASSKGILGKTISSQLGLSGYYLITGIETSVSKDDFTMNIEATWQHQGLDASANQSILMK
jgi:hypothetical protein